MPTSHASATPPPARHRLLTPAVAALGLGLFAYSVRVSGAAAVESALTRIGAGFLLVLAISAVRPLVRALAWTRVAGEGAPGLWRATEAGVIGDALGNVSPFGLLASEPARAALGGDDGALVERAAGVALENVLYTLTVAAMLVGAVTALLVAADVPPAVRNAGLAMAGAALAGAGALVWMLRTRPGRLGDLAGRMAGWRGAPRGLSVVAAGVRRIERHVLGFASRRPGTVAAVLALETVFHLSAVAEVYVTLGLLTGRAPTILEAFLFEGANRAITVLFKFVPMRLGVDEMGSGLFAEALHYGTATGVALALVRRARVLVWTAAGLALLGRRGLRARPAGDAIAVALPAVTPAVGGASGDLTLR